MFPPMPATSAFETSCTHLSRYRCFVATESTPFVKMAAQKAEKKTRSKRKARTEGQRQSHLMPKRPTNIPLSLFFLVIRQRQ